MKFILHCQHCFYTGTKYSSGLHKVEKQQFKWSVLIQSSSLGPHMYDYCYYYIIIKSLDNYSVRINTLK